MTLGTVDYENSDNFKKGIEILNLCGNQFCIIMFVIT